MTQYPIMSYEMYNAHNADPLSDALPTYPIIGLHKGQLLLFLGTKHCFDPDDIIFQDIERFVAAFLTYTTGQNCVVLVEGTLRGTPQSREQAICAGGEGDFATWLAMQAGIAAECVEPTMQEQPFGAVAQGFAKDEVVYSWIASVTHQWYRMTTKAPLLEYLDEWMVYLRRKMEWTEDIFNLDAMRAVHERLFGRALDLDDQPFFRDLSPTGDLAHLPNRIHRWVADLRDQRIAAYIHARWREGKHIFRLYAKSHAFRLERTLHMICDGAEF